MGCIMYEITLRTPIIEGDIANRPKYATDGGVVGFYNANYTDAFVTATWIVDSQTVLESLLAESDVEQLGGDSP